ncbi:hypothetical protein ABIF38_007544 [Bradyrhizobium japonicum]|uniref:hypothetical protein n=1 Tax=Bradyrhizobium elkanii TaxID=29448 RepID=UPI0009B7C4FE|nr:hypothetical protein [Bradyrhizobium elkanii]MCP1730142.1 hypothetical protein [Bradyrhizobium elkanii]MCS3574271.1 hypothetical protein [Bradyrhizobium elkanii]MCW2225884.1 hypothetical protein [Bradyrhizobium elkanii]NWL43561.1 hypothetical protein [Bradyrhizobium elkanii]RYM23300.1 hypothetical protein EWH13_22540 [Bradyrhizobium elkanii]
MSTVRVCRGRQISRKASLLRDQRGAVAFEMPIVFLFLIMALLLPLADIAIAGFQFISAWNALRGFGQLIQYSPPPDVTNTSSWSTTATAKADSRYPIPSISVLCGSSTAATCSSGNLAAPRFYSYSTSITLAPMVLGWALCASPNANPCTYTLAYSERFL